MEEKGFIGRIFDLSFSEFVTTKVIKFIFVLQIIGAVVFSFGFMVSGFRAGFGKGLLFLILTPVVFFVITLLSRIWCELLVVVFKIADNTSKIANQTASGKESGE